MKNNCNHINFANNYINKAVELSSYIKKLPLRKKRVQGSRNSFKLTQ